MTVGDLLKEISRLYKDRIAYRYLEWRLSYGELDDISDRWSSIFFHKGVTVGTRVLYYSDHPLYTVIGYFACLKLGAICIPINVESDIHDASEIIDLCKADFAVVTDSTYATISPFLADATVVLNLDNCFESDAKTLTPQTRPTFSDEDTAFIYFTSGSTGRPKGVMLSHRNIVFYALNGGLVYDISTDDVFLCHAPFHSDMSLFPLFLPLHRGASCQLVPFKSRWNPDYIAKCIETQHITVAFFVPSMLKLLTLSDSLRRMDSVRVLVVSGERISVKDILLAKHCFTNAQIVNLYGNTECNDLLFYRLPDYLDAVSELPLGYPLPYVKAILLNERMEECSENEVGELFAQSETMMQGYFQSGTPDAWVSVPGHRGKFFASKDLLIRRGDVLYYVGRKDRMIKKNAERVFPSVVETVLESHPNIIEAHVFAVRSDPTVIAAAIYGKDFDEVALRAYCAEKLPGYSIPSVIVWRKNALPRTNSGKIDQAAVQKWFATMTKGI